jgi:hypothetical protein
MSLMLTMKRLMMIKKLAGNKNLARIKNDA